MTLSLVIPVYNESENIFPLYRELIAVSKRLPKSLEILFVNDGSADDTQQKIEQLYRKDKRIVGIQLRTHQGKATALRVGFEYASGEIIITMDGDLQDDPREIPKFLAAIAGGADLVSGWKHHRLDPLEKTLPSRVFNFVTCKLTGVRLHDMNCGFKAYQRELAKSLNLHGELHRFIPVLAQAGGFSIAEVKIVHRPRRFGVSKYGWQRYFSGLIDLATILYLTRYRQRPLHIFGTVGLLLFSVGALLSAYLAYVKFVLGENIGHRPLLELAFLLIIVGVQIVMFGLIAQQLTYHTERQESVDRFVKKISRSQKG